ncbi:hypothetical protein [Embleya sp. NBC_00896]|nr:hypothetical protein OG928_06120 [Embleya sp. NBC_00896]
MRRSTIQVARSLRADNRGSRASERDRAQQLLIRFREEATLRPA